MRVLSQSELGKYFEWIIIMFIYSSKILSVEENEYGVHNKKHVVRFGPWVKRFPCYSPDGAVADKVDEGQTSFCGCVCDKTHPAQSVLAHIELWSEMDTKELLGTELE